MCVCDVCLSESALKVSHLCSEDGQQLFPLKHGGSWVPGCYRCYPAFLFYLGGDDLGDGGAAFFMDLISAVFDNLVAIAVFKSALIQARRFKT